jgi:small conductance mechanosensitive channel
MITLVTNRSRGFAYAVIDVNIPRSADLDRVFALMRRIGDDMRKDETLGRVIMDDVDIAGVEKLEDAVVGVRCRLKVLPPNQLHVRREFLGRMKKALDGLRQPQA